MLKILVTGATGFVGRHLVPSLVAAGYDVLCAVTQKVDWLEARQVLIQRVELVEDWHELLQGMDVVIHLAAKVHVMHGAVSLAEFCRVNTDATKKLALQAAASGVKRFIYMSSIKVNGESTMLERPFTEDVDTVDLDDAYAKSKSFAEQHLLDIGQNTPMDVVILRPSLVFGPGVKANFLKMLELVNKGWPLPFGAINNKRHLVYIDNLVSAIIAVISAPGAANQVYLVADDEAWSLADLLRIIAKKMNKRFILFPFPGLPVLFRLFGLSALSTRLFGSLEVSNDKLKQQLGWNPPVTSAEGISRTVQWYQNEYSR